MRQTMKKLLALLCVMAILLGLTACHTSEKPEETGPAMQQQSTQPTDPEKTDTQPTDPEPTDTEPTDPESTDPKPTEPKPTEPEPTEPQPTEAVSDLSGWQDFFDHKSRNGFYNDALNSEYATPADVNLFYLFYDGFEDEPQTPTEEENMLLDGKLDSYWRYADLIRLPADKVNAALMEMFGITLEQTNKVGLDKLVYLEETDCYYGAGHGIHDVDMTVQRVEHQQDGTILVYYNRENMLDNMVIALKPNSNNYQILSNLPETEYMDPEERAALEIVEEKIRLYKLYKFIGIACEYEDIGYVDMSRFLTEEQKEEYFECQYKMLCCHTVEEAKAHIDKYFGENVKGGYSEDKLFTDDKGNLYVIVIPTDTLGYNYIKVQEYSNTQIVATAKVSDLSETFAVATFTLQMIDGEFVVVSVTTENL